MENPYWQDDFPDDGLNKAIDRFFDGLKKPGMNKRHHICPLNKGHDPYVAGANIHY